MLRSHFANGDLDRVVVRSGAVGLVANAATWIQNAITLVGRQLAGRAIILVKI